MTMTDRMAAWQEMTPAGRALYQEAWQALVVMEAKYEQAQGTLEAFRQDGKGILEILQARRSSR